jgi:hypothetical protein
VARRTKAEIEAAKRRSESAWKYRLKRDYGITPEEYLEIQAFQGGTCYICQRANGRTVRLCVDHDHATGFIRGLLCKACNTFLGRQARDNPFIFANGVSYLEQPPAFAVIGRRAVPGHTGATTEAAASERQEGDQGSRGERLAA